MGFHRAQRAACLFPRETLGSVWAQGVPWVERRDNVCSQWQVSFPLFPVVCEKERSPGGRFLWTSLVKQVVSQQMSIETVPQDLKS